MRVLGLGWTQFATRWSSNADERIGTVAHLHALLDEIIDQERSRSRFSPGTRTVNGLPTEACPPQETWSAGPQLGTLDAAAQVVRSMSVFDRAQLEQLLDQPTKQDRLQQHERHREPVHLKAQKKRRPASHPVQKRSRGSWV